MFPSPRWPRPSTQSAGSGSTQSASWKPAIRPRARATCSAQTGKRLPVTLPLICGQRCRDPRGRRGPGAPAAGLGRAMGSRAPRCSCRNSKGPTTLLPAGREAERVGRQLPSPLSRPATGASRALPLGCAATHNSGSTADRRPRRGVDMSEAASVPFSETKAPEAPERLHRGALGLVDIAASTMANIGPAYSFYFGFGFLVFTAGVAAPLTIIAAVVAVALLGNTLAEFSRAQPSTGGFISFVGKTFGGTSAVTTALLCGAGYIIAISSVLAISGGFLSMMLQYYLSWNVPWIIFSVLLTGGAVVMTIRGVAVSTKLAGFFFAFEMLVLLVVSIAALIKHGGSLSGVPFDPGHVTNGFRGLAAGFPLAVYLFIGWENSAALAEETGNPRRNVPRAVFLSIAMMLVGYVLFAYATVTGFGYNGTKLSGAAIPFISVSHDVAAAIAFIAYIAGMTSTLGVLISRSEEHTSELQSRRDLVCRLLLEKKKTNKYRLLFQKKKKNNK